MLNRTHKLWRLWVGLYWNEYESCCVWNRKYLLVVAGPVGFFLRWRLF